MIKSIITIFKLILFHIHIYTLTTQSWLRSSFVLLLVFTCTASKQREKNKKYALHDHCAFVNSRRWDAMLRDILMEGFGDQSLKLLKLDADFSGQTDAAGVAGLDYD